MKAKSVETSITLATLAILALTVYVLSCEICSLIYFGRFISFNQVLSSISSVLLHTTSSGEPMLFSKHLTMLRCCFLTIVSMTLSIFLLIPRKNKLTHNYKSYLTEGQKPLFEYATKKELKTIIVKTPTSNRLILGKLSRGNLIATETNHSVIVIGPTQSGKTSGFVIPSVLEWTGPIIVTSVKEDIYRSTFHKRSKMGEIFVFDLDNQLNTLKASWNFLNLCGDFPSAMTVAKEFCLSSVELFWGANSETRFWYLMASKVLGPLLLASAIANLPLQELFGWINNSDFSKAVEILEQQNQKQAIDTLFSILSKDEKQISSVLLTLQSATEFFTDIPEGRNTLNLSLESFLNTGTIYIINNLFSSSRHQGYFCLLINHIVKFIYQHCTKAGKPIDPAVLLVLDEAANIAPLTNLANIASTARSFGIQLVSIFQDLSQLQSVYNNNAFTVFNNHRAKVLLSGCSDPTTVEIFSKLLGNKTQLFRSKTNDKSGNVSITTSEQLMSFTSTELRGIEPNHGILIYGHYKPIKFKLRYEYML